jgi:hypothetical protein
MVFKNDIATYSVCYLQDGKLVRAEYQTFAAAAGHAEGLGGQTRFLNVSFRSPDGLSSISGSLYCYSKITNTRRACNPYLIKQATLRNGR